MTRNQMFDENIYTEVNKESKTLLDDYKLELKSKGRAIKTIEQYEFDIKAFLCWSVENLGNKSILNMKKRDFRNFFLFMQETGKSSARINRFQSSLRNILAFAEDDEDDYEDYDRNVMAKIKSVEKKEVREIVFLSDEQITYLIDYLLEHNKLQKALYVSLSYDSGGRRNEIYQVTREGFLDEGVYKTNKVTGKRGKEFSLFYSQRTKDIARDYLESRTDDLETLWIVGSEEPQPLAYQSLYGFAVSFRSILESQYEEDIPVNSHSFRHSCAENLELGTHHMLKQLGKDKLELNEIRILLNHSDISTTQSYLKNKDEEIMENLFS